MNITPYPEINSLLTDYLDALQEILAKNLIGLYLSGSLSYGDFDTDSSDIDLFVVTHKSLNPVEIKKIKQLHKKIEMDYPRWAKRIECSYTPIKMLDNILPPKEPRPYYNASVFYNEADYGNEWIINNYLLYEHSIPLLGIDFSELIKPIAIIEVQKACIKDLLNEWVPKINDLEWLDNSHYQSYLVLTLCRILYTLLCGKTATKKVSAEWVKNNFVTPWGNLITAAENWKFGMTMSFRNETIEFIKFMLRSIKTTDIYKQMALEQDADSDQSR